MPLAVGTLPATRRRLQCQWGGSRVPPTASLSLSASGVKCPTGIPFKLGTRRLKKEGPEKVGEQTRIPLLLPQTPPQTPSDERQVSPFIVHMDDSSRRPQPHTSRPTGLGQIGYSAGHRCGAGGRAAPPAQPPPAPPAAAPPCRPGAPAATAARAGGGGRGAGAPRGPAGAAPPQKAASDWKLPPLPPPVTARDGAAAAAPRGPAAAGCGRGGPLAPAPAPGWGAAAAAAAAARALSRAACSATCAFSLACT